MLSGASRGPDAHLPHAPQGAAGARRRGRPVSKTVALVLVGLVLELALRLALSLGLALVLEFALRLELVLELALALVVGLALVGA